QRNRARRVIMAAYRELYPQLKDGYDLIFVARGRTPFLKSTDVLRCMEKQLKKAGVLK
ncbi:MAG: ribonuclease P protein component, partial [Clostridia bacterium]|nr:ribonuclease P protein component [Clostridia bacterium]